MLRRKSSLFSSSSNLLAFNLALNPPSFVTKMNELMNPDLEDWSDNLVGKVKQELKFTKEIEQLWQTTKTTLLTSG